MEASSRTPQRRLMNSGSQKKRVYMREEEG